MSESGGTIPAVAAVTEQPVDGAVSQGAVGRDLDDVALPPEASAPDLPRDLANELDAGPGADGSDTALESAMATGDDAGTPGEREPVDPSDHMGIATQDDSPLPAGDPGSSTGGPQDDGLTANFQEPPD